MSDIIKDNVELPRASEPLSMVIERSNWTGTAELAVWIHEHISTGHTLIDGSVQYTWHLLHYHRHTLMPLQQHRIQYMEFCHVHYNVHGKTASLVVQTCWTQKITCFKIETVYCGVDNEKKCRQDVKDNSTSYCHTWAGGLGERHTADMAASAVEWTTVSTGSCTDIYKYIHTFTVSQAHKYTCSSTSLCIVVYLFCLIHLLWITYFFHF